jgi:hypothetical protein
MSKGDNLHPHIGVGLEHPIEKGLPGGPALLVRFKQRLPLPLVGLLQGLVLLCLTIQFLQQGFETMTLLQPVPHEARIGQSPLSQLSLQLLRCPFHDFGTGAPGHEAWMLRLFPAMTPKCGSQLLQLSACGQKQRIDLLPPGQRIGVAFWVKQLS